MIYVVERYLAGLERGELLNGLRRLQQSTEQPVHDMAPVQYLGSTIVIGDDACYCQFEAPSPATVIDVNRRVGLPVDRIVPAVIVTPTRGEPR
jgi:Nickel responsive protein SCO4226-like